MQLFTVALLIANVIHTSHGAATNPDIKYPGPTDSSSSVLDVPEECKNLTFCTVKPKDYPQERFNWMFRNYKPVPQPALVLDITFDNRQGDPSAEDGCQSDVTFKPLYNVRAKRDNTWHRVVQAPDHEYIQRVRLETCKNVGASCFDVFTGNPEYATFCKQKYSTWKVLVDKGGNDTEVIETDLPVCCSCQYKAV